MSADFETANFKGYQHGDSIFVTTKENDGWGVMIDREMVAEMVQMIGCLDQDIATCVRCGDDCDRIDDEIRMIHGEPVCILCRKGRED